MGFCRTTRLIFVFVKMENKRYLSKRQSMKQSIKQNFFVEDDTMSIDEKINEYLNDELLNAIREINGTENKISGGSGGRSNNEVFYFGNKKF